MVGASVALPGWVHGVQGPGCGSSTWSVGSRHVLVRGDWSWLLGLGEDEPVLPVLVSAERCSPGSLPGERLL